VGGSLVGWAPPTDPGARPHPGSDGGPHPPDFSLESEKGISLVSNLTTPLPLRSATLRGARRARSIEDHRSGRGRRSGNRELWGGLVGATGSVFLGTRRGVAGLETHGVRRRNPWHPGEPFSPNGGNRVSGPLPTCGGGLGRGVFDHGTARPKFFLDRDFQPTHSLILPHEWGGDQKEPSLSVSQ
jgi:hypothetical protein